MKNSPTSSVKQSRRTFTASIAAALAAVPLIPPLIAAHKPHSTKLASIRPPHPRLASLPLSLAVNHMPPLEIEGGSLEIESAAELFTQTETEGGIITFKQEQDGNGCYTYGSINGVTILNDLGERIYSEMDDGQWTITLFLQKLKTVVGGKPEYETGLATSSFPAKQQATIRSVAVGSFELTIAADLGKAEKVDAVRLGYYRELKKYRVDKIRSDLGNQKFRIGQVDVKNSKGGKTLGSVEKPDEITEKGFKIFVLFDHPPACTPRENIKHGRGFWKRFLNIFKSH